MVFHHIQCPHCFTDYTLSDKQYREADGILRCGTCREQFKALLSPAAKEAPRFDPRDAFIEPLSAPLASSDGGDIKLTDEPEPSYVSYEKSVDPDEQAFELMSSHEFEYTGPKEEVPEEVLEQYGDSAELSTSAIMKNLRARQSGETFSEETTAEIDISSAASKGQLDLELPVSEARNVNTHSKTEPLLEHSQQSDESLIDAVDELVEQKLVRPATQAESSKPVPEKKEPNLQSSDFELTPRKRRKKKGSLLVRIISNVFWLTIALALIAALLYQLWLKQVIELPQNQPWFNKLVGFSEPHIEQLEEKLAEHDITLPQRRNLSQLELLSAQTEPHPTRATTVLLKVRLINRANISQPLPWLEMSLTDADGRLVARRNLSPKDYIYNNRTSSKIGPNELKKITIELLSFPKSATGYEIKLLDQ